MANSLLEKKPGSLNSFFLSFAFLSLFTLLFFGLHRAYSAMTTTSPSNMLPVTESLFLRGEALYNKQCASCHGAEGAGDGKAAYLLYPKPRDFTGGEFRLVSTIDAGPTEEDLFKTITRGMPGSSMPSWAHLSEEDRWGLVYYVCYLKERAAKMKQSKPFREKAAQGLMWEEKEKLITEAKLK